MTHAVSIRAIGVAAVGCAAVLVAIGLWPRSASVPVAPRRPSWLEPLVSMEDWYIKNGGPVVAVGRGSALVGQLPEIAGVSAQHGIVGYLRLPTQSIWVALGPRDEVLAATRDGGLWSSADVESASRGAFARIATVPDAVSWDVSGTVLAAATLAEVHVSVDGGVSFRASRPSPHAIVGVLAQSPSVVLAEVDLPSSAWPTTYFISRDLGESWRRSRYDPPGLRRVGSWLTDAMRDPEVTGAIERCPTVLAPDGTWRTIPQEDLEELRRVVRAWPEGRTSSAPAFHPAPPSGASLGNVNSYRERRADSCQVGARPLSPAPGPAVEAAGLDGGEDGDVVLYRDGPESELTRVHFVFVDDGICATTVNGKCSSQMIRPPHVVAFDAIARTEHFLEVPPRCSPLRILNARGLGLLLCMEGREVVVYAIDKTLAWKREVVLPPWGGELSVVRVVDDGTVALTTTCLPTAACRAAVRAPAEVGSPGAWWTPTRAGVVAFRPARGGAVMAVMARAGDRGQVDLEVWRVTRPHGDARVFRRAVTAPLESVKVDGDDILVNGVRYHVTPR